MKEAVECYKIALEKNPTLWVAFEKIVKISEFVNNQFESIPNLFHDHKILGLKKNISMNVLHKILFKDKKLGGKDSLTTSTTFSTNKNQSDIIRSSSKSAEISADIWLVVALSWGKHGPRPAQQSAASRSAAKRSKPT